MSLDDLPGVFQARQDGLTASSGARWFAQYPGNCRIAGKCLMEMGPALLAAASIVTGGGGITLIIREWLWLRFCRYVHDQAVERKQNPKPEVIIQAAREGRRSRSPAQRALDAAPKSSNKSIAA